MVADVVKSITTMHVGMNDLTFHLFARFLGLGNDPLPIEALNLFLDVLVQLLNCNVGKFLSSDARPKTGEEGGGLSAKESLHRKITIELILRMPRGDCGPSAGQRTSAAAPVGPASFCLSDHHAGHN